MNVAKEVAALQRMTVRELRTRYAEVFGEETRAGNIVKHEKIMDAVEGVLGLNVVAWSTSMFSKHPLDPSSISWHQDGTYWGLDSPQVTTAWIALSDSIVENSGIPRKHHA